MVSAEPDNRKVVGNISYLKVKPERLTYQIGNIKRFKEDLVKARQKYSARNPAGSRSGRKGRGLKLEKKESVKRGKGKKPEKRRKAAKKKFAESLSLNARRDGLSINISNQENISENQKLKGTLQNALLLALKSNSPETENQNETTKGVKP